MSEISNNTEELIKQLIEMVENAEIITLEDVITISPAFHIKRNNEDISIDEAKEIILKSKSITEYLKDKNITLDDVQVQYTK